MLKKIKQFFLSLACMIILLHAIIPHHHHSNKPVCINQLKHNNCDNHNNCCDFGDHEENHDFDKGNCIIDDYFTPKDDNEFQTYNNKTYVRMSLHEISSSFGFIINNIISDFLLKDKGTEFRQDNLTIFYKNPLAINNIGLRAPPVC